MDLQKAMTRCKRYLESNAGTLTLGKRRDHVKKVVLVFERDFCALSKDEPVQPNKNELQGIKDTLKLINKIALEEPINKPFGDFVMAFCLIAFNWNNNVSNDSDITTLASTTERLVELHLTTTELLDAMRHMLKQFQSMRHYALPSIELSQHYLETLSKKAE